MTPPKHAIDSHDGKGRYYTHPKTGELLVSVTNVLSTAMAKPALVPWAAKITAEKAHAMTPALVASMLVKECAPKRVADECGQCTPCVIKTIKREVTVVREKASDLGTRVHHHADAHVTGKQLAPDEEVEPYLEQYFAFLNDYGISLTDGIEAAELTVANPKLGVAGTLDLLVYLPLDGYIDGKTKASPRPTLWLVDIKTSATKPADTLYAEMPLQLAALKNATEMWLPDDTIQPMVRGIAGCAILNLRPDSYALIPVPTGTREWNAYKGLLLGTQWIHSDPIAQARPIRPDGTRIVKPTRKRATPVKRATTARKVA